MIYDMRILSWNVNGLRSIIRKKELQKELNSGEYDLVMLQETKSDEREVRLTDGYEEYAMPARSKKGYSGVLTFSRSKPLKVIYGINDEKFDREGRVITLEMRDYFAINAYFPNSRRDLSRLDYKMEFDGKILDFMQKLRRTKPVIIGGDFNVAHEERDIARAKQNMGNAGFTVREREFVDMLVEKGYIDTFRLFNSETGNYTWWTYRYKNARKDNIGWRIDYIFVSDELKSRVKEAGILAERTGSDHAPIYADIS